MNRFYVLAVFLALFISSCGGEMSSTVNVDHDLLEQSTEQPKSVSVATRTGQGSGTGTGSGSGSGGGGGRDNAPQMAATQNIPLETTQQTQTQTARKIIRNAELTLEADTPEETQKRITIIAESNGGFVVDSTQSSNDRRSTVRDTVTMTFRVPADKFSAVIEEIRGSAGRVVAESITGRDVTEEFIDIEARLKAQRALEEQFMEIMKRANTVADALNVQRQLAEVRGEIEKVEGRKRFLEDQSSLSTIKVRIQTPASISASGPGFFSQLMNSVDSGINAALSFVLGFITLIIALVPFFVLIVLPVFLLLRYFWKRIRRNRAVKTEAADIAKEELGEE